jgi:hypothetical protein
MSITHIQQPPLPPYTVSSPLQSQIQTLYNKDQAARQQMGPCGCLGTCEVHFKMLTQMHQEHFPQIKMIIDQYGWPGKSLVGEEGSRMIWVLVQHCDRELEFQKTCLSLLKIAVAKQEASKEHLAYLVDRILKNQGLPQLYGTQFHLQDKEIIVYAIKDEANLDNRRQEMGLIPFSDYIEGFKKFLSAEK